MNSIYSRNFFVTAGLVLLSFVILASAMLGFARGFFINERREALDNSAEEAARSSVSSFAENHVLAGWDLRMSITTISRSTDFHIFITDYNGNVVSCSDLQFVCEHLGRHIPDDVIQTISDTGAYDAISTLNGFYDTRYFVAATPIIWNSGDTSLLLGYAFAASDSTDIASSWANLSLIFVLTAAGVLLAALVLSHVSSKKLAKPLDEMAVAARKFAHGDWSARVPLDDRTDEIGALISAFNAMADSLERSEVQRREFIANVSHELKTPMTAIAGFADGILDGTIPPEAQKKYLATISAETKRLNRLVRDMLEMSRSRDLAADPVKRKDFDISELLVQTLLNFETRANEKHLDVDLQLPEERMMVNANPDAITQVVYNLLDNAVKFASPNSMLTLALWKQNGLAYVSVKNHGETIPPEELSLIFGRFHKTDRSRSRDRDGVGLGLYLVKSILNSHDQDIAVTSRDGVTEFVFTLALAGKPVSGKQTKAANKQKPTA